MDYKEAYIKLSKELKRATTMLDIALFVLKGIQSKTEQSIIADEANEVN
jgi:hypothetical protein